MPLSDDSSASTEAAAGTWLARRDRGLSAAEQDEYLQWLRERPEHAVAVARLERAWGSLDRLRDWRPEHSPNPNPDLLAPRRRRGRFWPLMLAAAAAVAIVGFVWWPSSHPAPDYRVVVGAGPQHLSLEDGSLIELNAGAQVVVDFSPNERRVRLERGEAYFVVAHDASRPFIVSADTYTVRAIGTAFVVNLAADEVSVLVTEGKVQLGEWQEAAGQPTVARELTRITAGQRATLRAGGRDVEHLPVEVEAVVGSQLEEAVAWQTLRLEFPNLPLREVVAEFNRFNSRKLIIEGHDIGEIFVGGTFRPDDLEPFVRVLEMGFGVIAEPRGNDLVLRRRP